MLVFVLLVRSNEKAKYSQFDYIYCLYIYLYRHVLMRVFYEDNIMFASSGKSLRKCWVSMKLVYRFFSRFICVETRVYHDTSSKTFILFCIYPTIFFQYFFQKLGSSMSRFILSEIVIKLLVLQYHNYIQLRNCRAYQALENSENHKIYLAVLLKQLYFYIRWSNAFPADTMLVISLLFPEA